MACVKWKIGESSYWVSTDVPYRHPVGAVNTGEIRWDCGKQTVTPPDEVDKQLANSGLQLGDTIAWVTKKLGVKQCAPCKARQEILNHVKQLGWVETLKQIRQTL